MNISKASAISGLSIKTVRYYADIELVSPVGRTQAGYRSYDDACVRKLIFIRRARAFGFSIEICRELLDLYTDETRSSADVKKIASKRLAEIKQKQHELQGLHDELAHLVNHCKGDDRPECPIISSFVQ